MKWSKDSWKNFSAKYIPHYDNKELEEMSKPLLDRDPLVTMQDIATLKHQLSDLMRTNTIIIQMGDCAETFVQATRENVKNRIEFMNIFAAQIIKNTQKKILKIGRIAGQYSKPRSIDKEYINGVEQSSYKGDLVHSYTNREQPNVSRFIQAYNAAANTIAYLNQLSNDMIYTSHECLLLPYETMHTKLVNNKFYNTSAHMLWLGYRTKFLNSAHIEYLRGIENPIGIKIGAHDNVDATIKLFSTLNPNNEKGKIIFICRFGLEEITSKFASFISTIKQTQFNIIWMIDPMHGNTIRTAQNLKTRKISHIIQEIEIFYRMLEQNNVYFAGLHLETTPEHVTECLDDNMDLDQLRDNYTSLCDPRLNFKQSLYLANKVNNLLLNK